jgi:XTP/dITP diphosphohydrolase
MPSLQEQSRLQVITASALLTESISLQAPVLITQIDSIEIAKELILALQAQFSENYPVSLLEGLTADQPQNTQTYLSGINLQDSLVYPVNLFLPAVISPALEAVQQLIDVVAKLRSPNGGCPWDLAQTPESLTPYITEEAYEVVDAIQNRDQGAIAEELGDLLLQVVLQAQIASEQKAFTLAEIAQGITQKLIRRHPHVFGDVQAQTIDQVHRNWEEIKAAEESQSLSQKLSRYARSLPPLIAGMKISYKAASAGLEWSDIAGVWAKFYEELAEFQEALLQGNPVRQQSELGDLLFTLINLARWCQLDPATALQETIQRFIQRLTQMETTADQPLSAYTLDQLEELWQQAKSQLEQSQSN